MAETDISWTDKVWNVTRGCRRISAGCGGARGEGGCYAERQAYRFSGPGQAYAGLVNLTANGPRWTGTGRFAADKLAEPLSWRRPARIFVDSMSDLFFDAFTNEQIAAVFGVMAACPHHTFQVLTKRAQRMRAWFETPGIRELVERFRAIALAGRIEEFFAPERILDLQQWPGYAVSSRGRIISSRKGADRDMTVMHGEQGHGRVMLYHPDGFTERPLVHRLVLATFDRPGLPGEQGCHIDGDATNNALWNLRWGSQSSNWDDSKRHGTRRRYSKLSDDQVAELRKLSSEGVTGTDLGRRFGISDTQARNIIAGRQWAPEHRPLWPIPWVWLGVSVESQEAADERIPELLATPAAVRFLSCEPLLGALDLSAPCPPHARSFLRSDRIGWVIAGCESGPGARSCDVAWLRSLRDQCSATGVPYFLKQSSGGNRPPDLREGPGSRYKGGGVIELPYLDGVQHAAFPEVRP